MQDGMVSLKQCLVNLHGPHQPPAAATEEADQPCQPWSFITSPLVQVQNAQNSFASALPSTDSASGTAPVPVPTSTWWSMASSPSALLSQVAGTTNTQSGAAENDSPHTRAVAVGQNGDQSAGGRGGGEGGGGGGANSASSRKTASSGNEASSRQGWTSQNGDEISMSDPELGGTFSC